MKRMVLVAGMAAVATLASGAAGFSGAGPLEVTATRVLRGSVEAPDGRNIPTRVHGFDARRAFLFLPAGRVLESVDAGRSWHRVLVRSPYGAPRFLTRTHWLASHGRRLYETRDGGRTWRFVRVLRAPFRAGHFVTGEFAYACSRSCVLTDDGGRTAARLELPSSTLCRRREFGWVSAAFSDRERGLAVCGGVPGAGSQRKEFWRTTDGERWALLGESFSGYVGRLEPLRDGSIVHHMGRVSDQISEDGGKTWRSGLPAESSTVASWVSARVAWARLPGVGDVFRTVDGGRHWRRVAPSRWPGSTSFCSPRTGFGYGNSTVGGAGGGFTIYRTRDGGDGWLRSARLGRRIAAVFCVSATDVFAATEPGVGSAARVRLLRSRDGGRRWAAVPLPADAYPPVFVTRQTFFAPGTGRTLYATRNGGRTWRRLRPGRHPVRDVAFRSADVGFVLVERLARGKELVPIEIRFTSDGGRTWRSVPVRIRAWRPTRVHAAGRTFWLFGTRCHSFGARCRPLVLRTRDDGRHWDAIELGVEPPWDARFVSDQVGVQPAARGLLVTRDGGVTWRWEPRGGF